VANSPARAHRINLIGGMNLRTCDLYAVAEGQQAIRELSHDAPDVLAAALGPMWSVHCEADCDSDVSIIVLPDEGVTTRFVRNRTLRVRGRT
jgi:hypothetical protein